MKTYNLLPLNGRFFLILFGAWFTVSADIVHRYSFNEPAGSPVAVDSVGGADGDLIGGADLTGAGQIRFSGENGYVDFPNGLISGLTDVTFEFWMTLDSKRDRGQPVFDFGNNTGGEDGAGTGTTYLYFSPAAGDDGHSRFAVSTDGESSETAILQSLSILPHGLEIHIAVTYSPTLDLARLYIDGGHVASAAAPLALDGIQDVNNWLGRSNRGNPFFSGRIDEFRIYSVALTAQQVAGSAMAGPGRIGAEPGPGDPPLPETVEPASVRWMTGDPFPFTAEGVVNTSSVELVILDADGDPVPAGTRLAVNIDRGSLDARTLFKASRFSSKSGGGVFYFTAGRFGRVAATFRTPDRNPKPLHAYAGHDDAWERYLRDHRVGAAFGNPLLSTVALQTPGDPESAVPRTGLPLEAGSVLPLVIGPNTLSFVTRSRTGDPYVFAAEDLPDPPTADIEMRVFDSLDRPALAGTPLKISVNRGAFFGAGMFYFSTGSSGEGGRFYFVTDASGTARAIFISPDFTPTPFSAFWGGRPGSTREEAWALYEERERVKGFTVGERLAETVTFRDDGEPVGDLYGLALTEETRFPIPVGPDAIALNSRGRDGNHYVFAAEGLITPESAQVEFQLFDSRQRPVPRGVPIAFSINRGYLAGTSLVEAPPVTSGSGGGRFFFRTGDQGRIEATYIAPQWLPPAFTNFRNNHADLSPEEAWNEFEKRNQLQAFDFLAPLLTTAAKSDSDVWLTQHPLSVLPGARLPFLVGPDRAWVETIGPYGDRHVFTSHAVTATARVEVRVFDGLDRPVPAETPMAFKTLRGMLFGPSLFQRNGLDNNAVNPGYYHFFKTGVDGKATLLFRPFSRDLFPLSTYLANNPNGLEDIWERNHGRTFTPGIWSVQFSRTSNLALAKELDTHANPETTLISGETSLPRLSGPDTAVVTFKPRKLIGTNTKGANPTKPHAESTLTISLRDTMGRPVPAKTLIRVAVENGSFPVREGDEGPSVKARILEVGRNSDVAVTYLSPDRQIWTDIEDTAVVTLPTLSDSVIGTANIELIGFAKVHSTLKAIIGVSPEEIKNFIFSVGKTIVSPVIFVIEGRNAMATARDCGREWRAFQERLATNDSMTDEEFNAAIQGFQNCFNKVRSHIRAAVENAPFILATGGVPTGSLTGGIWTSMVEHGLTRPIRRGAATELMQASVGATVKNLMTVGAAANRPNAGLQSVRPLTAPSHPLPFEFRLASWDEVRLGDEWFYAPGFSGLYEVFGFEFTVTVPPHLLSAAGVEPGEEFSMPTDFAPSELFPGLSFHDDVFTYGIGEITSVDADAGSVDGVIVGVAYRDDSGIPFVPVAETVGTNGATLDVPGGDELVIPEGALTEERIIVAAEVPPPMPPDALTDGHVLFRALAVLGLDETETTQDLVEFAFATPATVTAHFTADELAGVAGLAGATPAGVQPRAYRYDPETETWEALDAAVTDTSVSFAITRSEIVGLGVPVVLRPRVQIAAVTPDQIELQYAVQPGVDYYLETTPSLEPDAVWVNLSETPENSGRAVVRLTDRHRFFRVRSEVAPGG